MTQSYPQMGALLGAYFHQDFDLEFVDATGAADRIIDDNIEAPALAALVQEMTSAVTRGDVLDADFFTRAGVDTPPYRSNTENRQFFRYFIGRYRDVLARGA